jgi:hypothetical protein
MSLLDAGARLLGRGASAVGRFLGGSAHFVPLDEAPQRTDSDAPDRPAREGGVERHENPA